MASKLFAISSDHSSSPQNHKLARHPSQRSTGPSSFRLPGQPVVKLIQPIRAPHLYSLGGFGPENFPNFRSFGLNKAQTNQGPHVLDHASIVSAMAPAGEKLAEYHPLLFILMLIAYSLVVRLWRSFPVPLKYLPLWQQLLHT